MPAALQVLIATCRPEGISRVRDMNLPEVDGVEYLVMWQMHADAPVPEALAARVDVTVMRSELLLMTARRMGLNCRFFPICIVTHPGLSTGNRKPTAKTLHARGAIVALSHRWTWILRLPVHAWRLRSVSALGPLFAGALRVAFRRKTHRFNNEVQNLRSE